LGYAVAGATLGAQLGALAAYFLGATGAGLSSGGFFATLMKMTPKLLTQIARVIRTRGLIYSAQGELKSIAFLSFSAGIIAGIVAGVLTPGDQLDNASFATLSSYGGSHFAEAGISWVSRTLGIAVRSPGWAQLTLVFVSGYTLGFEATIGLRGWLQ
jgi:hypothetical protein